MYVSMYLCMYVCLYVCMYVTAVLKAVSLSGGHTVATELPTSMGIKQSSSLRLTMYICVCICIQTKGSGNFQKLLHQTFQIQWQLPDSTPLTQCFV